MGISFFNTPRHKVFHYDPLFYNKEKENMKDRYAKYGKIYEKDGEETDGTNCEGPTYIPGKNIRGAIRKNMDNNRKQAGNSKLKTILMILAVLGAIVVAFYLGAGIMNLLK